MPRPRNFPRCFAPAATARFACGFALSTLCGVFLPPAFAQSRAASLSAVSAPSAARFSLGSPLIRVGLMAAQNSRQIVLSATGGARLIGPDGAEAAAGLGPWTLTRSGSAYLISDAQNHTLGVLQDGSRWRLQCESADALTCVGNRTRRVATLSRRVGNQSAGKPPASRQRSHAGNVPARRGQPGNGPRSP